MPVPIPTWFTAGALLLVQKTSWETQLHGKGFWEMQLHGEDFFLVLQRQIPGKLQVTGAHFCELS